MSVLKEFTSSPSPERDSRVSRPSLPKPAYRDFSADTLGPTGDRDTYLRESRETTISPGTYCDAVCSTTPDEDLLGSNYDESKVKTDYLFINGISTSKEKIAQLSKEVHAAFGRPFKVIANRPVISHVFGVFNAALGQVSSFLGLMLKPSEVLDMADTIRERVLENNREVKVVAYSHGTIITSNALSHLQLTLPESDWQRIKENVSVEAYGAQMHWPTGIKVESHAHKTDPVPFWTRVGRWVGAKIAGLLTREPVQKPDATTIKYEGEHHNSHAFSTYMEDLPRFFIAKHYQPETSGSAMHGLVEQLVKSINKVKYGDAVHHSVIRRMLENDSGVEFARLLYPRLIDGELGKFVPYPDLVLRMQQLAGAVA